MLVIFTSDTHGRHRNLDPSMFAGADLLVHAGDITMTGELDTLRDFDDWMGHLPVKNRVVIGGNHDRSFEPKDMKDFIDPRHVSNNYIYLQDAGVEICGLKIWGSPWTPFFNSDFWRFHHATCEQRVEHWMKIPENLDILITHGPPNRILDMTMERDPAGDYPLYEKVRFMDNPPKVHVFGHIHEGYGIHRLPSRASSTPPDAPKTWFVNASYLDRAYRPVNPPWIWDTELDTIKKLW